MQTKPLTDYQNQTVQGRWFYLFFVLMMSLTAIDQYRRHDAFCWLSAVGALIFAVHSARGWLLKRRQDRKARSLST